MATNPNYRLHYYTGTTLLTESSLQSGNYNVGDIIFEANHGSIVVLESTGTSITYSRYGNGIKDIKAIYNAANSDLLSELKIYTVGNTTPTTISFAPFINKHSTLEELQGTDFLTFLTNQISGAIGNTVSAAAGTVDQIMTSDGDGSISTSGKTISNATTISIADDTNNNNEIPTVGAVATALEDLNNKFANTLSSALTFKGTKANYAALLEVQNNNTDINNITARNGDVYRVLASGTATIYTVWSNSYGWTGEQEVSFGENTDFFWHTSVSEAGEATTQLKGFWDILGTDNTDMSGKYDKIKSEDLGSNGYIIPVITPTSDDGLSTISATYNNRYITLSRSSSNESADNNYPIPTLARVQDLITVAENNINSKLIWSTWPTT